MRARYRWPLLGLGSLIVLLVALHLALPYLVRDYLNDKLADMGDYRGQVADVDLAWWRGAYQINGLKIVKTSGKVPVPFLDAPLIDLSVSWRSLWYDKAVVAEVTFVRPELNFVDGGSKQASQTGRGTDWRQQLEKLLPITLNEVRIDNGVLTFRNFNSKPPVDLKATQLNANIRNLTNVRDKKGRRDASFEGTALIAGDAKVESRATFDPFSDFDDFKFRLRATGIELRKLNDFASAYGKFDFNAGHGDVVIEAQAENGRLNGYIKPLLRCRRVRLATGRRKKGQGLLPLGVGGLGGCDRDGPEEPAEKPVRHPRGTQWQRAQAGYQRLRGVLADPAQRVYPGVQCPV